MTARLCLAARGGQAPRWDLSDLYPGKDSPDLKADLKKARTMAFVFKRAYQGNVRNGDAATLGAALAAYEALEDLTARLGAYADLVACCNLDDPEAVRFRQEMGDTLGDAAAQAAFLKLEINEIEWDELAAMLRHPVVRRFAPWIRAVRDRKPHQLAQDVEDLFDEKQSTVDAWRRLYGETMSSLRFPVAGEGCTEDKALSLLTNADRNLRREAWTSLSAVLGENAGTFGLIANTLCRDADIERRWRCFEGPASGRNLENMVEDEVVDALVSAVSDAYPRLSHRYYAMKARWLGLDRLEIWDRSAPVSGIERRFSWDEAVRTVIDSLASFSPEMAVVANRFFESGWIDAEPRPGKESGGFAMPTSTDRHPYLLVNFHGRPDDVTVLAHEVGHGVHMMLAAHNGQLLYDTAPPFAETASVFGEMLAFRLLLRREGDASVRRGMIAAKIEDMLDLCTRQVAFHQFETRLHEERQGGELSLERIGEMWMDVQRESLGPAVRMDGGYRHFWASITHFFDQPFYVYSYAFANCLVNSLYDVYLKEPAGFEEKYLDMLRAGGTKRHRDLLAPFGLNAADPAFWQRGLGVIEDLIDDIDDQ